MGAKKASALPGKFFDHGMGNEEIVNAKLSIIDNIR